MSSFGFNCVKKLGALDWYIGSVLKLGENDEYNTLFASCFVCDFIDTVGASLVLCWKHEHPWRPRSKVSGIQKPAKDSKKRESIHFISQ